MSSKSELATVYSSLILYDDKIEITAAKITTLCKAANIDIEIFWPDIMAKTLAGKDIGALLSNVGSITAAAPTASASTGKTVAKEEKAEETKEDKPDADDGSESGDDMGFGLFDDDD